MNTMLTKSKKIMDKSNEFFLDSVCNSCKDIKKIEEDANFWRLKYDLLLKHIKNQNDYRRYLERQVFGKA